jgi:PST family polysaccharide transporter
MILLKIANFFNNNGVNLLICKILSVSFLGIFDHANYIKNLPSKYLGHVLDRIMFPVMSELQDENILIFKVSQNGLGLSNALEIVLILLGENWMESVVPLQIMFGILALSISGRMADSAVRSKGLIYLNVKRKYAYVIVLMICAFFGSYYFVVLGMHLQF